MDDNVTDLDAYKIAGLIVEHWLDSYSDNGDIWARSKTALEVVRNRVSKESSTSDNIYALYLLPLWLVKSPPWLQVRERTYEKQ